MVWPPAVASAACRLAVDQRPLRRTSARSRRPARSTSSISTVPSRQRTVRTRRWSASSSAGGRVCGVTLSSDSRGPIVSASRTTTQPDGVFHVVERTFEPGSYARARRVVDAEGPEPEVARLTVEQGAEHAGRVEAREAQPVDRAVGRDQGAGVAVGQERVVGDGRERRRRRGALGQSRRPSRDPGAVPAAVLRRQPIGLRRPPGPRGVRVDRRWRVEQRLHDPPGLVDPVLPGEAGAVAAQRSVQEHLVRRGPFTALRRRTPCPGRSSRLPRCRCVVRPGSP